MVTSSKILTVTYGTFSCTLEGFDDPFTTLQMVAEYFRKLAAEDRYFGGIPQVPDADTLKRIAQESNPKGVAAEIGDNGIILRQADLPQDDSIAPEIAADELAQDAIATEPAEVVFDSIRNDEPNDDAAAAETVEVSTDGLGETSTEDGDDADAPVEAVAEAPLKSPLTFFSSRRGGRDDMADETADVADTQVAQDNPAEDNQAEDNHAEDSYEQPGDAATLDGIAHSDPLDAATIAATVAATTLAVQTQTTPRKSVKETLAAIRKNVEKAENNIALDASLEDDGASDSADIMPESLPQSNRETAPDLPAEAEAADSETVAEVVSEPMPEPVPDAVMPEAVIETEPKAAEDKDTQAVEHFDDAKDAHSDTETSNPQDLDDPIPTPEILILGAAEALPAEGVTDSATPTADLVNDDSALEQAVEIGQTEAAEQDIPHGDGEMTHQEATPQTAPVTPQEPLQNETPLAEATTPDIPEPADLATTDQTAEPLAEPEGASEVALEAAEDTVKDWTPSLSQEDEDDLARSLAAAINSNDDATAETGITNAEQVDTTQAETDIPQDAQADDDIGTPDLKDAAERRHRAAALLRAEAPVDAAGELDRLLETTQSKMNRPEQVRRMNALDQLKAAVAATEAEQQVASVGNLLADDDDDATDLAVYREDLRRAQSAPPASAGRIASGGAAQTTAAPLILVSEQRIDEQPAQEVEVAENPSEPTQDSLQTDGNLALKPAFHQAETPSDDDIQGIPADAFADATSFADFAERIGAFELTDLLEAAAAYTSIIEEKPRFSRAQVMSKIAKLNHGDSYSKEAGLRAFGKLLREGKILRVQDGQFGISNASRFAITSRYND